MATAALFLAIQFAPALATPPLVARLEHAASRVSLLALHLRWPRRPPSRALAAAGDRLPARARDRVRGARRRARVCGPGAHPGGGGGGADAARAAARGKRAAQHRLHGRRGGRPGARRAWWSPPPAPGGAVRRRRPRSSPSRRCSRPPRACPAPSRRPTGVLDAAAERAELRQRRTAQLRLLLARPGDRPSSSSRW